MQSQNPIVNSINVTQTTYAPAGYAIYTLQVLGITRFMPHTTITPAPQLYCLDARYSDMLELSNSISRHLLALEPKAVLPQFPPKKFFNNLSKEFLLERREKIQEYFAALLSSYGANCQGELIQFCSPVKLNVVVCGSSPSLQQLFITTLAFAARQHIYTAVNKSYCRKSDGCEIIECEELPLEYSKSETALTQSPFLSKLSGYSQDFPLDYSHNNYLYRVDVEEAAINEQFHKEHYPNLLNRWADNNNSVVITADLSSMDSVNRAIQIIDEYQKLIVKKKKPSFVVAGIESGSQKQVSDGSEIKKMLLSPVLASYETCYVSVDLKSGKGVLDALNNLITRKCGFQ